MYKHVQKVKDIEKWLKWIKRGINWMSYVEQFLSYVEYHLDDVNKIRWIEYN